jgi:hypothetical protein
MEFHENPSSRSRFVPRGQKDGQTAILRTDLRINKNGWVKIRSICYLSDSQLCTVKCRKPFRTICAETPGSRQPAPLQWHTVQVRVHWFACYTADCITRLCVHQVRAQPISTSQPSSRLLPLLVELHETKLWFNILVTPLHSKPSSCDITTNQPEYVNDSYYTIRLYNIVNGAEFLQPNAHVHETVSKWL